MVQKKAQSSFLLSEMGRAGFFLNHLMANNFFFINNVEWVSLPICEKRSFLLYKMIEATSCAHFGHSLGMIIYLVVIHRYKIDVRYS